MFSFTKRTPALMLGVGLLLGLLIGFGMMIGTLVGVTYDRSAGVDKDNIPPEIREQLLHATSATTGKKMALATGQIYDSAEGIFILDFLTGDLYCWVPNPKALGDGYIGIFKTNVIKDLGIEKGKAPDYLMVTGDVSAMRGGGAAIPPAQCVCYVADGNSGNVAAYSLLFDRTKAGRGFPQGGDLVTLSLGKARPIIERDQ